MSGIVVHFWVVIGGDWGAGVPVRVDTVSCICELMYLINLALDTAGYRWLIAYKVTFLYIGDAFETGVGGTWDALRQ